MRKVNYIDEKTFEKTEQEFENFHYGLAENIREDIINKYEPETITPIISNKEGTQLIVGVLKNRAKGQVFADKYRITIEKLEPEISINLTRDDMIDHFSGKDINNITLADFKRTSIAREEILQANKIIFTDGDKTIELKMKNEKA